jgi:hypothetical protein
MALMTRVIISIVLDMMMGAVVSCMWKEVSCINHDSVMARLLWHINRLLTDECIVHR